jgi:alkylation response protein AidB-like acyl-CoA dehydrogenase
MEFRLNEEEESFRRELSDWLDRNLPAGWGTPLHRKPATMDEEVVLARAWQRKLYDGGWAGISWPKEYGGRGATLIQQLIYQEEMARHRAPSSITLGVGIPLVGPTIIHHGTAAQKTVHLPRILAGEHMWCQGFSEPNSGSDLASLKTRGELVGDELVVNGQKIWTSYARYAEWCILLVRTDPNVAKKHQGITFALLDMKTPGITIRPLVEMTGHAWFNEVFFDNVRIPRANILGELNKGWEITMTTLGHERGVGTPHARIRMELEEILRMAKARGEGESITDPLLRQRFAQHWIESEILRLATYRSITETMRKGQPGPEGSILKLFWSELDQRIKETALEAEGPYAALAAGSERAVDAGRWQHELLWSRAGTIYAGTSEVQRNILGQRVLGLPRG